MSPRRNGTSARHKANKRRHAKRLRAQGTTEAPGRTRKERGR